MNVWNLPAKQRDRRRMLTTPGRLGLAAALLWLVPAHQSEAEEPARAFLEGLRVRGYHDVALEYLKQMETSRLAPAGFRDAIQYETALTLVESSRKQRDLEVRFERLDQAQELLKRFVAARESHPMAYAARSQLGNLIVERARIQVEQSKTGRTAALLKEARGLYEQAFKEFSQLEAAVTKELDQIPKVLDMGDRKQAALATRRTQLRADNLQTELLAAAIREETADTVPEGSKDHTAYLTEAADLYDGIYKKYRSRLAGLYARMYQGRCNYRLGKTKDALGYYGELLDQPSQPEAFWTLKTKALRLAMDAWLAPNQRKYVEAIKQASEWITAAPRNSLREPDLLAIRLSLARAYKMQADDYESRQPTDARVISVSLESAMKHATFVAGEPGELQEQAGQLVVSLGGRQREGEDARPKTFTEAQQAGKKALDAIAPASNELAKLQQQLSQAKPGQRAKLREMIDTAKAKLATTQQTAMESYRLAMQLADSDTPPSELNLVRYFVCYLYYVSGQHYESALVGDFVARRFPESAGARQCAKIALACYMSILEAAPEDDSDFETARLVSAANYIADTWPGGPEAIEATTTLVPVMVNRNRLDHAQTLTRRIPETAPGRAQAELVTGQAMWGKYLLSQQQSSTPEPARGDSRSGPTAEQAEIENMAAEATKLLAAGYGRLPTDADVTPSRVTALLSLAQAYVASSQHADAIKVLEDQRLGPLTLVRAENVAAQNPVLIQEAYRTALEAYIGSLSDEGAEMMEKAKAAMTSLQQAVGTDAVGKKRMLGIYVNLAQSVETQMKSAEPKAKQEMSQVFEAFLEELSAGSSDVGVLNWVAQTFASLGAGFDGDDDALSDDARKYYERSIAAFANLLSLPTLDPQLATQIKGRMASVKTQMRDYQGALADFQEILTKSPSAVNVQVEAARLLQAWAASDPSKYKQAISGLGQGNQGVIWGWAKIASTTLRYEQFRENFYEARYQMAQCQVGLAKSKPGAERTKLLGDAQRVLTQTKKLYPTLGGDRWKREYDELLNEIQSISGG